MSISLTSKLRICTDTGSDQGLTLMHWCPGCNSRHIFNIEKPNHSGAKWSWNHDIQSPSFTPSMNIHWGPYIDEDHPEENLPLQRCHYFLTNGYIEFLGDSTHRLSGQTIPLPDFPS